MTAASGRTAYHQIRSLTSPSSAPKLSQKLQLLTLFCLPQERTVGVICSSIRSLPTSAYSFRDSINDRISFERDHATRHHHSPVVPRICARSVSALRISNGLCRSLRCGSPIPRRKKVTSYWRTNRGTPPVQLGVKSDRSWLGLPGKEDPHILT